MYTQQTAIDPSLAALLQTAQMVTPDQTPTVAAQVAQAAVQKFQPQQAPTTPPGIGALMPGVRQQAVNAAQAAQPVTQAQVQQMMQQAGARSPSQGVAGLPADNMRTFTAAQGGVVGYAGKEGSYVDPQFPSVYENYVEPTREARTGREEDELFGPMKSERQRVIEAVAEELLGPMTKERLTAAPQRQTQQRSEATLAPRPPAPRPPAPRPPAPPAAPSAPQGGIAQLVAPTPEAAMASARSVLGLGDTSALRKKEDEYLAALKAQPATGQQGLAALQAQQAELQRMYEEANQRSGRERVIRQLLGRARGSGGAAAADIEFMGSEEARKKSYYELQVANATKRDAIIDLQNARDAGNAKAAVEAERRIREADLAIAKAEGDWAGHIATSQANVYGTQMQAETAAANRAQQALLEGRRLAQQAEQNGQLKLANQITLANNSVASAIDKVERELEKTYGQTLTYKKMMPPEQFDKNPGFVESYNQYLRERGERYKLSVDPAVAHRDRLAAQVAGTNVQRYDAKGNPIK